jgi:integrase
MGNGAMSRHQRGYIYEAAGAFHVRYYATADGVRKQLSHRLCTKDRATGCGSKSANAVRALCEDFMRPLNTDALTPSALTVAEFWEKTYYPFVLANLKHSTQQGYKQGWEHHLKAHFGKTLLGEYRTGTATRFLTDLAKTLRPRTLANIKCVASSMFAHAVAIDGAESNPWRDAKVLGKTLPNTVTESYSLEEIEDVISALVDRVDCQLMVALSFFLGLRMSEIQALQWPDFDEQAVHVRRAYVHGVLGTPKTLKSVRSVPLIAPVKVFLVLWRAKSESTHWLFPNLKRRMGKDGKPLGDETVNLPKLAVHVIQPILEKAGLRWKGYHAGRRGLGTTLRALTGNSNAGRDVLGHGSTQVTEQHYEHAMPEEALKGMRLLEAKSLNK